MSKLQIQIEADKFMKVFDTSGDGQVTWDEFESTINRLANSPHDDNTGFSMLQLSETVLAAHGRGDSTEDGTPTHAGAGAAAGAGVGGGKGKGTGDAAGSQTVPRDRAIEATPDEGLTPSGLAGAPFLAVELDVTTAALESKSDGDAEAVAHRDELTGQVYTLSLTQPRRRWLEEADYLAVSMVRVAASAGRILGHPYLSK